MTAHAVLVLLLLTLESVSASWLRSMVGREAPLICPMLEAGNAQSA